MKLYFDQNIVAEAEEHAKEVFPQESCGFILDDEYLPMDNIAKDKVGHFKIDPKQFIIHNESIRAIVHSHGNYPHASKMDMEQQIASGIPWGIINIKNGAVTHTVFYGDQLEPQHLVGRPFFHGVYDCYSLVRDHHRERGITIPIYPRENLWWETEPSMLLKGYAELDYFHKVDPSEAQPGDVVLMTILAEVVNHSAILLEKDCIVHHLYGKLSRVENIKRWKQCIGGFYRYIGDE